MVHALTSYSRPALEDINLSGIIQDWDTYHEAMNAYRCIIEWEVRDTCNAQIVNIYPFSPKQIFCNLGDRDLTNRSLADLAGLRPRTYPRTHWEGAEDLGATSITLPLAEVAPALERGVADCGITRTQPAY